ncbi:uncharacterized protein LOC110678128 [Aedes aegypti]|uniref:Uncharacterized protein n=1 Tax=Aedes aegypti TaxID=7159 RepID=A0A6I8U5S9_AEDAE|nr:uncharacterized protein LOC110678128 [Aedes aegypti]
MKLAAVILVALVATLAPGRALPASTFELQTDVETVDDKQVQPAESTEVADQVEDKDHVVNTLETTEKDAESGVTTAETTETVGTTSTTNAGTSEVAVVRSRRAVTCTDIVGVNGETETVCDEDQDTAASEQPSARSYHNHHAYGHHQAYGYGYKHEPKKYELYPKPHYG